MVFQNHALYPQMTVAQNLGFALEPAGKSRAQIASEVAKAAEILSLIPQLNRKPAQLLGGRRQRVAMGRAIVRHPKVFLFDEPLSNPDAKLRVHMRAEIRGLHHRLAATVVYVTHDQIEAMTMADKIVVLNAGRVEQIGSPLHLYDNPVNLFVAGFQGGPAVNFLPASLASPTVLRLTSGATVEIPSFPGAKVGQSVILGIRPEHLTLAGTGLEAEVKLVEPTGAKTPVMVSVEGADVSVVLKERQAVPVGARVTLAIDTARTHLCDAAAGMRLPR